ncbi:FAD-dependent oxidoreductase [Nocardia violaceofusca]|uniref:FAD-dependent oxidoreductase n=1 Tax=Nocardia violaceofusca TaxID=941182 RepID=UPI0007A4A6F8|nr:NAD(P)/FAD-dependent oxidoreductase [Nocardia violaceofusca]
MVNATEADAVAAVEDLTGGEYVLRTFDDARRLRMRLETARSAIVVGAGFLGMEVASACVARGIAVTVIDVDPPLERILGPFLSKVITDRTERGGVRFVRSRQFATLAGNPVHGVALDDETELIADVVVTCAGEVPNTAWLNGSGLADVLGVGIDRACTTEFQGVYAAGDVTYLRDTGRRVPFWSNARRARQGRRRLRSGSCGSHGGIRRLFLDRNSRPVDQGGRTSAVDRPPDSVEGSLTDGSALLIGATVVRVRRWWPMGNADLWWRYARWPERCRQAEGQFFREGVP